MAILGAETSTPAAPAPCCIDCAPPAQRRQLVRTGAALVLGAARSSRRPYPELLGDLETDWVPKRTEIDGATEELNAKILAFQRETLDQVTSGSLQDAALQGFLRDWNAYIEDWQNWRGDSLWLLTWRRRNQLLEYRARLNHLFDYWKGLPGASPVNVPSYSAPETGGDEPDPSPWASTAKWVAIGALGVAGAVAVAKIAGVATKFTPAGLASSALRRNPGPRRRRRRRRNPCSR